MDKAEQIIRFLDGEMSIDERNSFLSEIEGDDNLKSEVEAYENVIRLAKTKGESELRVLLDRYMRDHRRRGRIFLPSRKYKYLTGIAAIITLMLGFFFWNSEIEKPIGLEVEMKKEPIPIRADSSSYLKDSIKSVER